jgi:hypothetical protein
MTRGDVRGPYRLPNVAFPKDFGESLRGLVLIEDESTARKLPPELLLETLVKDSTVQSIESLQETMRLLEAESGRILRVESLRPNSQRALAEALLRGAEESEHRAR